MRVDIWASGELPFGWQSPEVQIHPALWIDTPSPPPPLTKHCQASSSGLYHHWHVFRVSDTLYIWPCFIRDDILCMHIYMCVCVPPIHMWLHVHGHVRMFACVCVHSCRYLPVLRCMDVFCVSANAIVPAHVHTCIEYGSLSFDGSCLPCGACIPSCVRLLQRQDTMELQALAVVSFGPVDLDPESATSVWVSPLPVCFSQQKQLLSNAFPPCVRVAR